MNDLVCAIGSHKAVLFEALDLSAAFDTVDHSLLASVLLRLGVRGTVTKWFKSYLLGREQQVKMKNVTSGSQELTCGVPQGSVLGPLLFSLYSASLGQVIRKHHVQYHFYADDSQLWLPFNPDELDAAVDIMQSCLHDVSLWMAHHKLKLNVTKTEFLVISSAHHARVHDLERPIVIESESIAPSSGAVRNLGVLIDPRLSMETFITHVCKGCFFWIHNINRIKRYLDFEAMEKLIHCFITSKLDFCNSLFLGLPATQLQRLQRVQNAAARILTCTLKREHIRPVLFQLHWLPMEARVVFKVLLLIHKSLIQNGPKYIKDLLIPEENGDDRRSSDLLKVPFTRSALLFDRAFSIAGPRLWNQLPAKIRAIKNTDHFKRELKTHLFRQFYQDFLYL
jgi:hypothetical protein